MHRRGRAHRAFCGQPPPLPPASSPQAPGRSPLREAAVPAEDPVRTQGLKHWSADGVTPALRPSWRCWEDPGPSGVGCVLHEPNITPSGGCLSMRPGDPQALLLFQLQDEKGAPPAPHHHHVQ